MFSPPTMYNLCGKIKKTKSAKMSGRKSIPQVFFQQSKRTLSNIKLQLIPKLLYSANRRQNPSFEARVT